MRSIEFREIFRTAFFQKASGQIIQEFLFSYFSIFFAENNQSHFWKNIIQFFFFLFVSMKFNSIYRTLSNIYDGVFMQIVLQKKNSIIDAWEDPKYASEVWMQENADHNNSKYGHFYAVYPKKPNVWFVLRVNEQLHT